MTERTRYWEREDVSRSENDNQPHSSCLKCRTRTGCKQSFLLVGDSATSQPSLLCVSAGEESDAVLDYDIRSTDTVFQLSESLLSFSDLAQLVLFYSLSRDVLAVRLSIPSWIHSVIEKKIEHLSSLDPNTWLCSTHNRQTEEMTHRDPSSVLCSIQLTSANGALCIVNPLYLHEHGDDWLTRRATAVCCTTQPSNYRQDRRLSTTRAWAGAGLQSKRTASLHEEQPAASVEGSVRVRAKSVDLADQPLAPSPPTAPVEVLLRETSRSFASRNPHRADLESLPPSTQSTPGGLNSTRSELPHVSTGPQSSHRVSWIEDGVWLPPPRPSSWLQLPSLELDSLSMSSVEEEQEPPSPSPHYPSPQTLADKVIHRLSVVGQAISGLVSQRKRLTNRVQELSERNGEPFSEAVRGFVEVTLKRRVDPGGVMVSEFLQEVRLSLTSLRETLLDCKEIQGLLDSLNDINDSEIDLLVELSLQKVALKPISAHLYSCIHASRTDDGTIKRLQSNLRVLEKKGIDELGGSTGVGVPDSVTVAKIQQQWTKLHKAYSPNKKVQTLLGVCKSIYHSMSANASSVTVYGADEFLPCLTWVLLRSDVVTSQLDTDYMMELLDPTQLQGEGGYYLTTLYASLYYISSFQPRLATRQLSVEAQQSLDQWHRRRTLHCNQSRHSNHRQTIRRRLCWDKGMPNSRTEPGSEQESEKESESERQALCAVEEEERRGL